MYDLIYANCYDEYKELKEIIETGCLTAVVEDASDTVHTYRFSVDFEIELDDWFIFLLKNKIPLSSLNFQITMRTEPDKINILVDNLKIIRSATDACND